MPALLPGRFPFFVKPNVWKPPPNKLVLIDPPDANRAECSATVLLFDLMARSSSTGTIKE